MKKRVILILVLLYAVLLASMPAQTKEESIDKLIGKYTEYRLFNGSVLVADNFNVILKKGYGLANMEWNIPNEADTKHRLGSVTKQFTSMLIMQLVNKGKIKLDGKITDYLPYYRKDTGEKVTVEMLLTHSSGVPSYTSDPDFVEKVMRRNVKPDDFVKERCSGNLQFEPGKKFVYSNSGYFILGAIIEKVSGKSYTDCLKEYIFNPLGMKNSGYDYSETIVQKRAAGYDKTADGYRNTSFCDMSVPFAAGSLYSTVEDIFIWDKALETEKLLPKDKMNEIFKARINGYGFGWGIGKKVIDSIEYTVVQHSGGINGFNTNNYVILKKGQVVILLNNTGGAPLGEITNKIIDILNGKEVSMPAKPKGL